MEKPRWIQWFIDTGERLQTADDKTVEVWEFRHEDDQEVLSTWAIHFRKHYCLDCDIDSWRGGRSRKDYLNDIKFPGTTGLGPSIRAGDFGEILIADYLQWILNHWVPRLRWSCKATKDESPKGCDVIGFRFHDSERTSSEDLLTVFETKTCFSRGSSRYRLQDAVNGSAKDHIRIPESLNYLRQLVDYRGDQGDAQRIERFQNPVDVPYRKSYGAAALFTSEFFDESAVLETDTGRIPKSTKGNDTYPHPNRDKLVLLVIRGEDMMNLVHELYRRSADEA